MFYNKLTDIQRASCLHSLSNRDPNCHKNVHKWAKSHVPWCCLAGSWIVVVLKSLILKRESDKLIPHV